MSSPAPESTATAVPDTSRYWEVYAAVAARQVRDWAPPQPSVVLELAGGGACACADLSAAGHAVVHVGPTLPDAADVVAAPGALTAARPEAGRVLNVVADARALSWLRDGSVDAVLAQSRALSTCLATEITIADLTRTLRPGGRLLLVVESLGLGLARLAEQGRWAELADVPSADVVLVPAGTDGSITRCFRPDELRDLLTAAGLEVEWVRPRTVLTSATVEHALRQGGRAALEVLVDSELALAAQSTGESQGLHLVASARRPG